MKIIKGRRISFLLLMMFSAVMLLVTGADAQTVHALLVIMDDDPEIGENMKINRDNIREMLGSVKASVCNVETTILLGSHKTADSTQIIRWLNNISPAGNDVVFLYYSGHGGKVDYGMEDDTYLSLQDGSLYRSTLVEKINTAMDCRLKILVTDCCSNVFAKRRGYDSPDVQGLNLSPVLLKDLFLRHRGFLHVTAATEGEYGWSNREIGGYFTKSFVEAIHNTSDTNHDKNLSWKEVISSTRKRTMEMYGMTVFNEAQRAGMESEGVTGQTPKAYSLPDYLYSKAIKRFDIDEAEERLGRHREDDRKLAGSKSPRVRLRSNYEKLSVYQVQSISHISIRRKGDWGFRGHSTINHDYKVKTISGDKVVVEHSTGLMWHQSGSSRYMKWGSVRSWINKLNGEGYAGYNDWRLPTVEEAASLLEQTGKKNNNLYINPVFSEKQDIIWTGDSRSSGDMKGIVAIFLSGAVVWRGHNSYGYVRPVRSWN